VNERPALGLIVVAGFIGTIFDIPPIFALTAESFLTLERANVSIDDDGELEEHLVMEFLQKMEMPS
jgi:heat shock protein HspQ